MIDRSEAVRLLNGDCVRVMRDLPAASVDAVVTDPPYGLEFMGKGWDAPWKAYTAPRACGDRGGGEGCRCPKSEIDGTSHRLNHMAALQAWHLSWALQAFRVLKPGGHLLAFGGPRTYHRLACAVEDAGFEVRDSIAWLYGTGFPKSLDVGRAVKKLVTDDRGASAHGRAPESWQGWGTGLKPAHEPIVIARKPIARGNIASNCLEFGTSAINIDACRIHTSGSQARAYVVRRLNSGASVNTTGRWRRELDYEGRTSPGRWPANVVLSHSPRCRNLGVRRVPADRREGKRGSRGAGFFDVGSPSTDPRPAGPLYGSPTGIEKVEAWECVDGCPVAELDQQAGTRRSGFMRVATRRSTDGGYTGGFPTDRIGAHDTYGDSGSASRFFYVAKASSAERNLGLDVRHEQIADPNPQHRRRRTSAAAPINRKPPTAVPNVHPTVKPLALMRYLCRLVTAPGGVVLDPFMGSGTTGMAAVLEDLGFIGIEREHSYLEIAKARIDHVLNDRISAARPRATRRARLSASSEGREAA